MKRLECDLAYFSMILGCQIDPKTYPPSLKPAIESLSVQEAARFLTGSSYVPKSYQALRFSFRIKKQGVVFSLVPLSIDRRAKSQEVAYAISCSFFWASIFEMKTPIRSGDGMIQWFSVKSDLIFRQNFANTVEADGNDHAESFSFTAKIQTHAHLVNHF